MRKEKKEGAILPVNKKEILFLPPPGRYGERRTCDHCKWQLSSVVKKVKKDKKGKHQNRENSSRMEAHEVAPDVVDVAPADVIKVKFTQIVQRGENLNRLSASER